MIQRPNSSTGRSQASARSLAQDTSDTATEGKSAEGGQEGAEEEEEWEEEEKEEEAEEVTPEFRKNWWNECFRLFKSLKLHTKSTCDWNQANPGMKQGRTQNSENGMLESYNMAGLHEVKEAVKAKGSQKDKRKRETEDDTCSRSSTTASQLASSLSSGADKIAVKKSRRAVKGIGKAPEGQISSWVHHHSTEGSHGPPQEIYHN
jgi:hypothetical protein